MTTAPAGTRTGEEQTDPAAPAPWTQPRLVIPWLWLFATLNYLYCDVLGTHDPAYLRELMTGTVGGIEMTERFLLGAAGLMTIPMASVLVSRIAPRPLARIESIVAGVVMTVVQAGTLFVGSEPTSFYIYFSAIEIATTAAIVWIAWRHWRRGA